MSYWEDLDDHLGRLEPNDLNLDYLSVSHLDCVSRVAEKENLFNNQKRLSLIFYLSHVTLMCDSGVIL